MKTTALTRDLHGYPSLCLYHHYSSSWRCPSFPLTSLPSFALSSAQWIACMFCTHFTHYISNITIPLYRLAIVWQVTKSDITGTLTSVCNKALHDHSCSNADRQQRREGDLPSYCSRSACCCHFYFPSRICSLLSVINAVECVSTAIPAQLIQCIPSTPWRGNVYSWRSTVTFAAIIALHTT